jgi:putative flippase GtrA
VIYFLRFNLVGLLGIAVQLATLALLNRALPHDYLLTSTLAVELTLLHNFAWHLHYTWPQTKITRRAATPALLRFHLSNGLISLFGNLLLMRLFAHSLHIPILLANAITIACCGLANFSLAHHWVFSHSRSRANAKAFTASCLLVLLFAGASSAQSPSPPSAPSPQSNSRLAAFPTSHPLNSLTSQRDLKLHELTVPSPVKRFLLLSYVAVSSGPAAKLASRNRA